MRIMYDAEETCRSLMNVLRNEKKAKAMGYNKLAQSVGLSNATIYHWINGTESPMLYSFIKVLDALGYELIARRKPDGAENG